MTKFVVEILKEINDDPRKILNYTQDQNIQMVFNFAFRPEGKFLLPEGVPPYKEDAAPLGMSPANFAMELKKWYIFCRQDLRQTKREILFIQLLEKLHPSEAKLMIAIKDQDLTSLYPNITHKLVHEAGFVPNAPVEEVKPKKSAKPKVKEEEVGSAT